VITLKEENKEVPAKITYSIWDTQTEENLQVNKEAFAKEIDQTNLQLKTKEHND